MSPANLATNMRLTRDVFEPPAEAFLGDELAYFNVAPYYAPKEIGPGESATDIRFMMPQKGVPFRVSCGHRGVCMHKMTADGLVLYDLPIWDGHRPFGATCSKLNLVRVDLKNESAEPWKTSDLRLICAFAPDLHIGESFPGDDRKPDPAVVKELHRRYKVNLGTRENDFDGIRPPLWTNAMLGRIPPFEWWKGRGYQPEPVEGSELCITSGLDRWTAPLLLVCPPEVAEHYHVTEVRAGEKAVAKFERPIPASHFVLGHPERPPLPFITIPYRQSFSVLGKKIHDGPAPPFEMQCVYALGKRTVA
jgi:hypothetical protein